MNHISDLAKNLNEVSAHCIQSNAQLRSLSIRQPYMLQMSKLTYNCHIDRLIAGGHLSDEEYIKFHQKIDQAKKPKPLKKSLHVVSLSAVRSQMSLMKSEIEAVINIWEKLKQYCISGVQALDHLISQLITRSCDDEIKRIQSNLQDPIKKTFDEFDQALVKLRKCGQDELSFNEGTGELIVDQPILGGSMVEFDADACFKHLIFMGHMVKSHDPSDYDLTFYQCKWYRCHLQLNSDSSYSLKQCLMMECQIDGGQLGKDFDVVFSCCDISNLMISDCSASITMKQTSVKALQLNNVCSQKLMIAGRCNINHLVLTRCQSIPLQVSGSTVKNLVMKRSGSVSMNDLISIFSSEIHSFEAKDCIFSIKANLSVMNLSMQHCQCHEIESLSSTILFNIDCCNFGNFEINGGQTQGVFIGSSCGEINAKEQQSLLINFSKKQIKLNVIPGRDYQNYVVHGPEKNITHLCIGPGSKPDNSFAIIERLRSVGKISDALRIFAMLPQEMVDIMAVNHKHKQILLLMLLIYSGQSRAVNHLLRIMSTQRLDYKLYWSEDVASDFNDYIHRSASHLLWQYILVRPKEILSKTRTGMHGNHAALSSILLLDKNDGIHLPPYLSFAKSIIELMHNRANKLDLAYKLAHYDDIVDLVNSFFVDQFTSTTIDQLFFDNIKVQLQNVDIGQHDNFASLYFKSIQAINQYVFDALRLASTTFSRLICDWSQYGITSTIPIELYCQAPFYALQSLQDSEIVHAHDDIRHAVNKTLSLSDKIISFCSQSITDMVERYRVQRSIFCILNPAGSKKKQLHSEIRHKLPASVAIKDWRIFSAYITSIIETSECMLKRSRRNKGFQAMIYAIMPLIKLILNIESVAQKGDAHQEGTIRFFTQEWSSSKKIPTFITLKLLTRSRKQLKNLLVLFKSVYPDMRLTYCFDRQIVDDMQDHLAAVNQVSDGVSGKEDVQFDQFELLLKLEFQQMIFENTPAECINTIHWHNGEVSYSHTPYTQLDEAQTMYALV